MLPNKEYVANIGIGFGLALQAAGAAVWFVPNIGPLDLPHQLAAVGLVAGGALLLMWGCGAFAQYAQRSGWLGLLGIFSLLGVLVVNFTTHPKRLRLFSGISPFAFLMDLGMAVLVGGSIFWNYYLWTHNSELYERGLGVACFLICQVLLTMALQPPRR